MSRQKLQIGHKDAVMSRDAIMTLVVFVLTTFVMMLNETTLSVALPSIMTDFSVTAATAQWLLTGVMLTIAIIMPATGWVIDRFSTRQVFLFAVIMFLMGTIVAAISPTFSVMLLARVLQAVGTAVIMPLMMTVVMTVIPANIRGTIMGIISVIMAVAPALGPSFAGLILSFSEWHMIFLVLVPLVGIAGLIGAWKLSNIGDIKRTPLDALSLVLSAFAFGGLIYGLSSIGIIIDGGTAGTIATVVSITGALALALFVWRQIALSKSNTELLNLSPLKNKNFAFSLVILMAAQAALLSVVNMLPLYLQGALLTTALVAGMMNLPGGLVETIISPIAGNVFDRVGTRPLVIPGAVIMAVSLLVLGFVASEETPVWFIVAFYVVLSIGIALLFGPLMTTALGSLEKDVYSHGSAIVNTLLQLVGAAGTAVLIAIYSYISVKGGETESAQADGASAAFIVAGCISLVAVAFSFFVRDTRRDAAPVPVDAVEPR